MFAEDVPAPSQWPDTTTTDPGIETWANAIRFAGPDRAQTAQALALGLRGDGGYPFDTTDPSSGGASDDASGWWGAATCPRAIIVVAGDTPADALAASALSDPTDNSTEPYLQRSAAADPLFDPVGGFARVDTESAPIVVTSSARRGATGLSVPARSTARDLRSGGCRLARQAIIVGGPAAVPPGVEADLVGLGYDEVFRVSGSNRYGTAAAVAGALGTGTAASGPCDDPAVDAGHGRMGWYANAAIELRDSATSCRVLGRTVVGTDGVGGADARAAGWWTSYWQVPVLLHDGTSGLPTATAAALAVLPVDHVVVLGGPARIPDVVLTEIGQITGADVTRIAGADRYATSVEMARRLGGWWPTGRAVEYAGSIVCLAASSGDATGQGWPDALAAGPWCAAANAAGRGAPRRALAPLTGGRPATTPSLARPAHDAIPVILVPAGATALPATVADFLTAAFEPSDTFCSSVQALTGCVDPGFIVAIGGTAVLPSALVSDASRLVAGGGSASGTSRPADLVQPFLTNLDLAPVYATDPTASASVCVGRNGYVRARWLSALGEVPSDVVVAETDLMSAGRYVADADGVVRRAGTGAPGCLGLDAPLSTTVRVRPVGIAGRVGTARTFATTSSARIELTDPITDSGPAASSGTSTTDDASNGGSTTQTYVTSSPGISVVSRSIGAVVTSASLTIRIDRGVDGPSSRGVDAYTASIVIDTPNGTITAESAGEAILSGGTWRLRGRTTVTGGTWNVSSGLGGFTADLDVGSTPAMSDDTIDWRFDAVTP
ncbi:MAG: cell wall-binding repeat-containing protein [Ilumatobacteraceae bacterium]